MALGEEETSHRHRGARCAMSTVPSLISSLHPAPLALAPPYGKTAVIVSPRRERPAESKTSYQYVTVVPRATCVSSGFQ
jgi:hypothetical protein